MIIEGDGYTITYKAGLIQISGKLSLMLEQYTEIEEIFSRIISSQPSELLLDVRNLEYLNSSGIKTICVGLILEAADVDGLIMKILCSDEYTWQKETIPTFEGLMENLQIIFE